MKTRVGVGTVILLGLGCLSFGCRAHPGSLAMMFVGDVVAGTDVDRREKELLGRPPAAADTMFGQREDTFVDLDDESRQVLWYPADADLLSIDRWLVETYDDETIVLTRTKENIDGVEDVVRSVDLRSKVIGKSPDQCQQAGRLKHPVARFKSVKTGDRVYVYDVRNFTNLRGARYCLLRFGDADTCKEVKLVGVSASTEKQPLGKNSR